MEEASGPPVEIWPDNAKAVDLFVFMGTQWRTGMGGAIGLDYNVLFSKMNRMSLTAEQYDQLESDVRIMEYAALETMREE